MSRTDKTRPYWVKVNDHGVEHHDHSQLGEEVWRSRPIKDENGKIVHENAPVYVKAEEYIQYRKALRSYTLGFSTLGRFYDEDGYRIFSWRVSDSIVSRKPQRVWDEAIKAVAENRTDKRILLGTYLRPKTERYLAYTIADHCTIDEKQGGGRGWQYGPNPCYMEADWSGADAAIYRYRCSCCHYPPRHGSSRAQARDTLKGMVNAYNTGYDDFEDDFEQEDLTPNRRATKFQW